MDVDALRLNRTLKLTFDTKHGLVRDLLHLHSHILNVTFVLHFF